MQADTDISTAYKTGIGGLWYYVLSKRLGQSVAADNQVVVEGAEAVDCNGLGLGFKRCKGVR